MTTQRSLVDQHWSDLTEALGRARFATGTKTVLLALAQPPGCEVRELVVACSEEGSWP